MESVPLLVRDGRRRSSATRSSAYRGLPPRNKGLRYPPDPPTIEEIDAVRAPQLLNAVEAISAPAVGPLGREEIKLVVMAQHARRYLGEPSKLSDVQHGQRSNTPSHRVKVKGSVSPWLAPRLCARA